MTAGQSKWVANEKAYKSSFAFVSILVEIQLWGCASWRKNVIWAIHCVHEKFYCSRSAFVRHKYRLFVCQDMRKTGWEKTEEGVEAFQLKGSNSNTSLTMLAIIITASNWKITINYRLRKVWEIVQFFGSRKLF